MTSLKKLKLTDLPSTDAGRKRLQNLANLGQLQLAGTKVTDAAAWNT